MYLKDLLNIMWENTNIKIKEHSLNGRIFYDGKIKDLKKYIKNHNNLNLSDGFPIQVMNINNWIVSEVIVDKSIKDENNIPDYNRSKIIIIF